MASCHARAVMLRRKEYRDETNYNVALAIATHMGSDGRPATVSLATIAEYAHCHYNTADKRTKEMWGNGQVIMGKCGRYLAYSVPYDGDDGEPEGDGTNAGEVGELRQEVSELKNQLTQLAAAVAALSHDLHTIVTRPSHDLHTTFTSTDEDNVSKEGKKESIEEDSIPNGIQGDGKKTKSKADPRSQHPAIKAMKGILGRYPNKDTYDLIIGRLGETPNTAALVKARSEWTARGFNPANVLSQLEWYDNYCRDINWIPQPMNSKNGTGAKNATHQRNNGKNYPDFQPVSDADLEWWQSVNAGPTGTDTT